MARIDDAIVDTIAAAIGSLTKGTNIFTGPLRPAGGQVPGKAVFVLAQGGPGPTFYSGDAHSLREPAVQIMCRGESGEGGLSDAQAQADAVYTVVEDFTPAGSIGALVVESIPNYLGSDEQGRHLHSINLRTWKRSDT